MEVGVHSVGKNCISFRRSATNFLKALRRLIGFILGARIHRFSKMVPNVGGVHGHRLKILVTGGAGYIGSHTTLQLLLEGYLVVIIDNLDNSCEEAVIRVQKLAGSFGQNLTFFKVQVHVDVFFQSLDLWSSFVSAVQSLEYC